MLDQREHRSSETRGAEQGAHHVHAAPVGCARLTRRDREPDQRHAHYDQREVDEEDPAPRCEREQLATRQRPEHAGNRAPRRPAADRRAALLLGERVDDHRESTRRQQRAGDPLDDARGDQRPDRGRERARQRGQAEAANAELEDAPLAEDITERASEQDQRTQRQQVAVGDPLLRRKATPERALDRGQRDVDHRAVEQRDPRAEDARHQRQALARALIACQESPGVKRCRHRP